MADIDFDELDKAVNSLMNQHNSKEAEEAPDSPVTDTNTGDLQSEPVDSSSPEVPSSADSRVAPSSLIARRQSGRFMDVVHPSSDMRNASTRQELSSNRTSARRSSALQPITNNEVGDVGDTVQSPSPSEALASEDSTVASGLESTQPMESPFLTDVEVNKRPLGALAQPDDNSPLELAGAESVEQQTIEQSDVSQVNPIEPPIATSVEGESVQEPGSSEDKWSTEQGEDVASVDMPVVGRPELSAEVLALESMDISSIGTGDSVVAQGPASESLGAVEVTVPNQVAGDVGKVAPQATEDKQSSGGLMPTGDIAPQYKASDAENPEPSAVFEAASESPQPLTHPEKKKSGWMVLVWIIILLLVGVAGGVLVWYFLVR